MHVTMPSLMFVLGMQTHVLLPMWQECHPQSQLPSPRACISIDNACIMDRVPYDTSVPAKVCKDQNRTVGTSFSSSL